MDSAQPFDQFKDLVQMLKPSAFSATKPQPSPHTNIPHQSILPNTTAVSSHSVVDSEHIPIAFISIYIDWSCIWLKLQNCNSRQSFGLLPTHSGHDWGMPWVGGRSQVLSNKIWGSRAHLGAACKADIQATKSAPAMVKLPASNSPRFSSKKWLAFCIKENGKGHILRTKPQNQLFQRGKCVWKTNWSTADSVMYLILSSWPISDFSPYREWSWTKIPSRWIAQ